MEFYNIWSSADITFHQFSSYRRQSSLSPRSFLPLTSLIRLSSMVAIIPSTLGPSTARTDLPVYVYLAIRSTHEAFRFVTLSYAFAPFRCCFLDVESRFLLLQHSTVGVRSIFYGMSFELNRWIRPPLNTLSVN
jgi:hypothetical protein